MTEAYSFLPGYRRYGNIELPAGSVDRHDDEVRRIAEALGARRSGCISALSFSSLA